MIKRINNYGYWCVLTAILTAVCIVRSGNYEAINGIMIFLFIFASLTLLHLLVEIVFKFKVPAYFKYDQDIFYDVQWQWDWNTNKEIMHLKPFCPVCKSPVYYTFDTLLYKTEFVCEPCNKQLANINSSDRNFVIESVKKSIVRKLKKEDSNF
jgi:hypothetical protein